MPKALVLTNLLAVVSEPAGKRAGDQYFNTTESILYVYDGTTWNAMLNANGTTAIDGGTPTSVLTNLIPGG